MPPLSTADSMQLARPIAPPDYASMAADDRTLDMPLAVPAEPPSTVDLPMPMETTAPSPARAPEASAAAETASQRSTAEPALPPALAAAPGVGSVLRGRFQLTRLVGTGGFSQIFEATDLHRLGAGSPAPFVAIKLLKEGYRSNPEAIDRLKREFARLEALSHPHIGHAFDVDRDGDTWFLVLELLEGQPLSTALARLQRPLPRQEALSILQACGEALAFAHQRGILHCDFKPGNVLISQTDEVRVIDFGSGFDQYARSVPAGADGGDVRRQATPAYASPEALAGEAPDVRDDVYSFAAVAFELLTGTRFTLEPLARPALRPPGVSRRQWTLLQQALSPLRANRPASLQELLQAFAPDNRQFLPWLAAGLAGMATTLILLWPLLARDPAPPVPPVRQSAPALPSGASPVTGAPFAQVTGLLPPVTQAGTEAEAATSAVAQPIAPVASAAPATVPTLISLDQPELRIFRPTAMAAMIVQRRSGPPRAVRVHWRTVPGTALPGIDYQPVDDGIVQFADNQDVSSLYVPLMHRNGAQMDRTFYIELIEGGAQVDVGPVTRVAVTIGG